MKGLHLLRYHAVILCAFVLPGCISVNMTTHNNATTSTFQTAMQADTPSPDNSASTAPTSMTMETFGVNIRIPFLSPEGEISTIAADTSTPTTHYTANTDSPKAEFVWRHCVPLLMVTGGLILACTILLLTTLMLVWKVCQLNRRLKALGSNDDLISNSDYWIGTAKKNRSKYKSEAAESSMLMTGFSQTQELRDESADKDEERMAKLDGQQKEETQAVVTVLSEEVTTAPQTTAGSPQEANNVQSKSP